MTENQYTSIGSLLSAHKEDKIATDLLTRLSRHLNAVDHENRINAETKLVHDFDKRTLSILDDLPRSKTFLEGFDNAATIIGSFFNIMKKSSCPAMDRDFLVARMNELIEAAEAPDYEPIFSRNRLSETRSAQTVVDVHSRLRRVEITATISRLEQMIEMVQGRIANTDARAIKAKSAEVSAQLVLAEKQFEQWKTSGEFPADFTIMEIFKGWPGDQFLYNIKLLTRELDILEARQFHGERELEELIATLAVQRRELERLDSEAA